MYVVGGVACMYLIDSEQRQFTFTSLILLLPATAPLFAALQVWPYIYARPDVRAAKSTLERVLWSVVAAAICGVFGLGYKTFINAATSPSPPVLLEGMVVKLEYKPAGRGHGSSHHVTFLIEEREVTFTEHVDTFTALRLGDIYRTEARMGGLGDYWRPQRSRWN